MTTPTITDFARLEDRVDDTLEKQFSRMERKLDEVGQAVTKLMVFEERYQHQIQRAREMADEINRVKESSEVRINAMADRFDARQKSMAERFEARTTELDKHLQGLQQELHGHVQRYLGIGLAASGLMTAAWAVGSKFIH